MPQGGESGYEQVPTVMVATKVDKLKKSQQSTQSARLKEALALPDGQPLPFSAKAGIGQRELWQYCQDFCRLSDEAAALKQKKK